jgi:hypothetical protein
MLTSYVANSIRVMGALVLAIIGIKVILGALSIGFDIAIFGTRNFVFLAGAMVAIIGGLYRQ